MTTSSALVASKILELLQHLLRCPKEQRCLVIGILKSLARHDDTAVYLILRIKEMHVAGGDHQLVELSRPALQSAG